jgi:hypothetical protein
LQDISFVGFAQSHAVLILRVNPAWVKQGVERHREGRPEAARRDPAAYWYDPDAMTPPSTRVGLLEPPRGPRQDLAAPRRGDGRPRKGCRRPRAPSAAKRCFTR